MDPNDPHLTQFGRDMARLEQDRDNDRRRVSSSQEFFAGLSASGSKRSKTWESFDEAAAKYPKYKATAASKLPPETATQKAARQQAIAAHNAAVMANRAAVGGVIRGISLLLMTPVRLPYLVIAWVMHAINPGEMPAYTKWKAKYVTAAVFGVLIFIVLPLASRGHVSAAKQAPVELTSGATSTAAGIPTLAGPHLLAEGALLRKSPSMDTKPWVKATAGLCVVVVARNGAFGKVTGLANGKPFEGYAETKDLSKIAGIRSCNGVSVSR